MERRVIDIDGPRRREREEGGGGRIPVHKKVAASKTRSPPKICLTTTATVTRPEPKATRDVRR